MEDTQIIDLYWTRDQRAIQETEGKYGRLLHSIAWNLLRSREDAEECVNDTYLRAWEAIPPARPGAFRIWLGQITRNLSLDRWKSLRAEKRGGGAELLLPLVEPNAYSTASATSSSNVLSSSGSSTVLAGAPWLICITRFPFSST